MTNTFKERVEGLFSTASKTLACKTDESIGPVNKEKLWIDAVKQVAICMKTNGFYYEIEETPPPIMDAVFGIFCEVAIVDETGVGYEAVLKSFHYGDKGESQIMQIRHLGNKRHTFVSVTFRSNQNTIRLTPDSEVIKRREISNYPKKLDLNEESHLLSKLSRATVDEKKTLEWFNKRVNVDHRSVAWIRDMPLLPGLLE